MKRHNLIAFFFFALLLLFGCGKEEVHNEEPVSSKSNHYDKNKDSIERRYLEEFLENNPEAEIAETVYHLDGEIAYYVVVTQSPNAPSTKIAIDSRGVVSTTSAREKYSADHKEKFGIIHVSSYGLIEHLDDSEEVLATAWLVDGDASADAIEEACGVSCDKIGSSSRIMDFYIRRGAVIDVAKLPEVQENAYRISFSLKTRSSSGSAEQVTNVQSTAGGYANTLYTNNQNGQYGQQGKVGIVELIMDNCAIFEAHESLTEANVFYQTPANRTCDLNASPDEQQEQCNEFLPCVGSGGTQAACVDDGQGGGICVSPHASTVASRISSTLGSTKSHGAELNIYVANSAYFDEPTTPLALESKYNWLLSEGVRVVNESFTNYSNINGFGPGGPLIFPDSAALMADTFARDHGLLIVKAAGNRYEDNNYPDGYNPSNSVFCTATNGICVGSVNANLTYYNWAPIYTSLPIGFDAYLDDELDIQSRWGNTPNRNQCDPGQEICVVTDIERPDVASEGDFALALDFESTTSWQRLSGTSQAAPVVAGLIAMESAFFEQNNCWIDFATKGNNYYLLAWRAYIRNRSMVGQNINPAEFYPIPGQSQDSYIGAGIPLGKDYGTECDGVPTENGEDGEGETEPGITSYGAGEPEEDLSTGWETPPSYWSSIPSFETTNISIQSDIYQSALIAGSKPGALKRKLIKTIPIAEIDESLHHELRMTTTFNSCPDLSTNPQPETIPFVDYDVVLCVEDLEICYAESSSIRDTAEGFHIVVPKEYEGYEHSFFLTRSADATDPCPGYDHEAWRFGARHIITP